jgi:uncharacterized protein YggE
MSHPLRAALVLVALTAAACQSVPPTTVVASAAPLPPRSISVTGTAEIATAPDELTVNVGVESFAADPQAAKDANDRSMKSLVATARAFAPNEKDVRTEGFTLQQRYEGPYDNHRLTGYEAKKMLVVVIHDSDRVEAFLTELFKGGANRLDGVTYGSSKLLEQRKEARTLAVTAAREKATAMAATLGQKLGRPLKVEEETDTGRSPPFPGNMLSNAFAPGDTRGMVGQTMATGKIRIPASVAVTFELLD